MYPFLRKDDDTMAKAKYVRQKDGYFQTKVWDGTYTDTGKKHYITLRSKKSSKDLEAKVNELNNKVKQRQFIRKSDVTFYEYAQAWKLAYKSNLELNTQNMYTNIIEKHLVAISCNISEVNRAHYITLINETEGDRTKQQIAMVFKQVVKSAIRDRLLPADAFDEIFLDTVKIKYKSTKKRALEEHEKKALAAAVLDPMDKAFVYILYGCGLRRGEAIALTRFDISLDRREITVNKAVAFDVNNPIVKDTKNTVHRVVPIPDSVFPVIRDYVKSMGTTYLFHMKDGRIITKSSLDKMWKRIIRKMNEVSTIPIEGLTPHIFRHNYCANLCYQMPNISICKIAELLGDSQKMVVEVYNHEVSAKEKPAEIVSVALAL